MSQASDDSFHHEYKPLYPVFPAFVPFPQCFGCTFSGFRSFSASLLFPAPITHFSYKALLRLRLPVHVFAYPQIPPDYDKIRISNSRAASIYRKLNNYEKAIFHSEKARELALKSMEEKATELGANAIINVRIKYSNLGGTMGNTILVSVNGTAVLY